MRFVTQDNREVFQVIDADLASLIRDLVDPTHRYAHSWQIERGNGRVVASYMYGGLTGVPRLMADYVVPMVEFHQNGTYRIGGLFRSATPHDLRGDEQIAINVCFRDRYGDLTWEL